MTPSTDLAARARFWRVFMPRHHNIGGPVTIDARTADACRNIIETTLDMFKDLFSETTTDPIDREALRRALSFPGSGSDSFTVEMMLNIVLEQLKSPKPG